MRIIFWSDYACPFCWIGEVRLRKALKELGLDDQAELIPRAFEINPNAPEKADVNGLTTIARQYNMPLVEAAKFFDQIAEYGRQEGLELNQVNTQHTNTFNSHRLMKLGLATGDWAIADKLNELLFAAFFVENLNLADRNVLLEIGKKAGLNESEVMAVLESDKFAAEVRADEYEAAKLGVRGVPYFVFENGVTAPGAISTDEFISILKNAAQIGGNGIQCGPEGCLIH